MSFEPYLAELADPAQRLAVSKLINLSSLGPEEASLFMKVWPEMELSRRQQLVAGLIELAEDNVDLNFDAVFFVALGDRDAGVRRNAVRGLWEYEGRDLLDSLIGMLESDANAGVRAEAALALGRFVLRAEFDALSAADAERVERALRRAFDDEAEAVEVRGRALEALGARGEPWVRDLIERSFDDGDRQLRLSAVHAMGRSCDTSWLPALFDGLESDDAEMRFEAAGALGSMADEAATPHLLPLLNDEDAEVQDAVIVALGEIGDAQAREALREIAADSNERLREAAAAALAAADFNDDPLGVSLGSREGDEEE